MWAPQVPSAAQDISLSVCQVRLPVKSADGRTAFKPNTVDHDLQRPRLQMQAGHAVMTMSAGSLQNGSCFTLDMKHPLDSQQPLRNRRLPVLARHSWPCSQGSACKLLQAGRAPSQQACHAPSKPPSGKNRLCAGPHAMASLTACCAGEDAVLLAHVAHAQFIWV